jgi:phytoene/squalene synthetase
MNPTNNSFIEIFNTIEFEKIKDHPNILIAANFWDNERYKAAKTCYKFLRAIDDLIDDHKTIHTEIAEHEKKQFNMQVDNWIKTIIEAGNHNPLKAELIETINKFKIPFWPLEDFAKSMVYDIYHDGFATINDFIDYAGGASVAPASIFVHLCGLTEQNSQYIEPCFDLREASTPCAIFSYLVHIIRDFQKDQLNHLNYFADDVIVKNKLTRSDLKNIAHGAPVNIGFRNMIEEYVALADIYKQKTYEMIDKISPCMDSRYQLSLEIIFNLYLMVFERIDIKNGLFTAEELNPTPQEIRQRVYETILNFN